MVSRWIDAIERRDLATAMPIPHATFRRGFRGSAAHDLLNRFADAAGMTEDLEQVDGGYPRGGSGEEDHCAHDETTGSAVGGPSRARPGMG